MCKMCVANWVEQLSRAEGADEAHGESEECARSGCLSNGIP